MFGSGFSLLTEFKLLDGSGYFATLANNAK